MFITKKLSTKLTSAMINSQIINDDEKDIYIYCFDYIFELALVILSFLLIGLFSNRLLISCIFLIVVFPLRSFGGGIHASNSEICTVLSYLIYIIAIIISPLLAPIYSVEWLILLCLEYIIITILAPVDTPNKRLTIKQRTHLKRQTIYSLLVILLIFVVLYIQNLRIYYGTISICGIIPTISIILGHISNKLREDAYAT